jgi:hypothetical protein
MAREIIKQILGYYRRKPHVFWGYWRTPGEFFDIAESAGLKMCRLTNDAAGNLRLKSVTKFSDVIPPLSDSNLVITLEAKDSASPRQTKPASP